MPAPEAGPVRLEADPHRLERIHVINVRFFSNLGTYGVEISEGGHLSWRQWCEWGCAELRQAAHRAARDGEAGGDHGPA